MKALVYSDWEKLELQEVPQGVPGEGEARLRVQAVGICGSELEAVRKHSPRRKPPLILGHEFTGAIEQLGAGAGNWKVGDEVVSNAIISDGTCEACRRGMAHLCVHRELFGMHRPGAMAETVVVPVTTLIPRPTSADPAAAALSEPLANGVHICGLLKSEAPKTVVVFGAGPIGLLTMQAMKHEFGSRCAVVDLSAPRLALAKRLGAELAVTPDKHEEVSAWAGLDGIEASVDAVGAEETKSASVSWVRAGGTAVWIGLHENSSDFNSYDLILPEKRVLGSYACTQKELATALDWISKGVVDVSSWISLFPLAEAEAAFATMLRPGPGDVKGVILMQ